MAHSMSEACTPLKLAYDSCFNAWFEGYLRPAVSTSSMTDAQRATYSKQKADEYEEKCGKIWRDYKSCVQKAIVDKGLDQMLGEATRENPLDRPPSIAS